VSTVLKYFSGTGVPEPSKLELPELLISMDPLGPSDTNWEWPSLVDVDPVALIPNTM
jgi:hypothetical protein